MALLAHSLGRIGIKFIMFSAIAPSFWSSGLDGYSLSLVLVSVGVKEDRQGTDKNRTVFFHVENKYRQKDCFGTATEVLKSKKNKTQSSQISLLIRWRQEKTSVGVATKGGSAKALQLNSCLKGWWESSQISKCCSQFYMKSRHFIFIKLKRKNNYNSCVIHSLLRIFKRIIRFKHSNCCHCILTQTPDKFLSLIGNWAT